MSVRTCLSFSATKFSLSSDIDYEYPSTSALGQGFADLCTEMRKALDGLASRKGDTTPYLLTAAVSAGAENYANLRIPQMNSALNYWNLMVSLFPKNDSLLDPQRLTA